MKQLKIYKLLDKHVLIFDFNWRHAYTHTFIYTYTHNNQIKCWRQPHNFTQWLPNRQQQPQIHYALPVNRYWVFDCNCSIPYVIFHCQRPNNMNSIIAFISFIILINILIQFNYFPHTHTYRRTHTHTQTLHNNCTSICK